jgi:V/A-type H+-transporting ATPase subunit E
MADDLQSLLDRIQKDGVDRAEVEARKMLAEAKAHADRIVAEAGERARRMIAEAGESTAAAEARGRQTLQQAARDTILTVEDGVQRAFRAIAGRAVDRALTVEVLQQMLVGIVESYISREGDCSGIAILVPKDRQSAVADFFMKEFQDAIHKGLTIQGDPQVLSGFRVSMADDRLYHDFSREAIVDALCQFLRPQLAELMRGAGSAPTP